MKLDREEKGIKKGIKEFVPGLIAGNKQGLCVFRSEVCPLSPSKIIRRSNASNEQTK